MIEQETPSQKSSTANLKTIFAIKVCMTLQESQSTLTSFSVWEKTDGAPSVITYATATSLSLFKIKLENFWPGIVSVKMNNVFKVGVKYAEVKFYLCVKRKLMLRYGSIIAIFDIHKEFFKCRATFFHNINTKSQAKVKM